MEFGHTEIFVREPVKSKEFYTGILEFELVEIQIDKYVWLKSGNSLILLRPLAGNTRRAANYDLADTGFVLYTDNLQESAEKMRSKGLQFQGIDGSDKCLTFTDPDGNWFQLVNPNDH